GGGSLVREGVSEAQGLALLRGCDRRRAAGRRDYAVIVLMLRLGLRAGEVAALRLEDIDWRAGQVTVHGKRARVDQLPVPADVGKAIAGYLQRGRPRTAARQVFVRTVPPPAGLSGSAVATIVPRPGARAGLAPFGAHRLRHTTACDMLRAGGSLAEIGQVLRHESAGATAVYARVDVERLRTIARAWPAGAASLARWASTWRTTYGCAADWASSSGSIASGCGGSSATWRPPARAQSLSSWRWPGRGCPTGSNRSRQATGSARFAASPATCTRSTPRTRFRHPVCSRCPGGDRRPTCIHPKTWSRCWR